MGGEKNTVVDKNPEMPVPIFGKLNIVIVNKFNYVHTGLPFAHLLFIHRFHRRLFKLNAFSVFKQAQNKLKIKFREFIADNFSSILKGLNVNSPL